MKHDTTVGSEALRIDAVRGMIRVLDSVGGAAALAQLLGDTLHAVTHWREIPVRHVFAAEAATGIPHWEIRPDIDFAKASFHSPWAGDWVPVGVDVTGILGAERDLLQERAFRAYQGAHRLNQQHPNLRNARLVVEAWGVFADAMGIERV